MAFYNILGLIRIESEVRLRELEKFRATPGSDADIIVRVRSGRVPPSLGRRILQRNQSLSYIEHLGSLGATVQITPKERVSVEVSWLLKYSNSVLYVNVVEPLLRLFLASKGFGLVHSACISRRDNALLISAPPDTGKTTTVLRSLANGWFSFLSDDMTVLGPDRSVYCFPKPFTISAHTYAGLVEDKTRAKSFSGKMKLRIKSYVHSRTGRMILRTIGRLNVPILTLNALGQMVVRPPKIFVEDLVRGMTASSQARPVAVCLLRKGGEKIVPAPPDQALKELLINSEEAFGFPPYSDIWQNLVLNGRKASEFLEMEKALLEDLVNSAKCFWLYSDSRRWDLMLNEIMDKVVKPTIATVPAEITVGQTREPELTPKPLLRH